MKLLALSDLHSDEELLDRLRMLAARESFDAALFCGDITERGPSSYAGDALSLFPRSFAVFGNMDTPEIAGKLDSMGVLIHGKKARLGKWNMVGLGGSNPTPFHTPTEFSEEQLAACLARAGVDSHTILLSHAPPFGVFDSVGSLHVGSRAVRDCIEAKKPLMAICGHIHEHEGQEILGETLVVKLAPAEKMRAARIEITDEIGVDFFTL